MEEGRVRDLGKGERVRGGSWRGEGNAYSCRWTTSPLASGQRVPPDEVSVVRCCCRRGEPMTSPCPAVRRPLPAPTLNELEPCERNFLTAP